MPLDPVGLPTASARRGLPVRGRLGSATPPPAAAEDGHRSREPQSDSPDLCM